MNDLFTAFQNWIQGQINLCVDGLLARVTRLEELRIDDQITGLRMENDALRVKITGQTINLDNLYKEMLALRDRVTDLEDRHVEGAPDQALESFQERVYECFDSEAFRDAVANRVTDCISDEELVTTSDLCSFIRENVRVELDVSRY